MFYIKVYANFSSAHNLREYQGNCENLHGHNWRVEAVFKSRHLGDNGLLLDFREARQMLAGITARLDHKYLNDLPQFSKINPSSENIAIYIANELKSELKKKYSPFKVALHTITVWENERSVAVYEVDGD